MRPVVAAFAFFYILLALAVLQAKASEWKLIARERTSSRVPIAIAGGTMAYPRWFRIDAAAGRQATLAWDMTCPRYFLKGRERVRLEMTVVLRPPRRSWCHLNGTLFAPIGKRAVMRVSVWGVGGRVIVP